PEATKEDIDYLIEHVNRYMNVGLTADDILTTYAGYRPLVESTGARTANLSRTHVVVQEDNGMVTIVGGKLTTYRRMAQDTVDVLARRDRLPFNHPTQRLLLSGAIGWRKEKPRIEARGRALGLDAGVLHHLEFDYGGHAETILDLIELDRSLGVRLLADLPYLRAEIVYISRYEMAVTLDDMLARRTRIDLLDRERGTELAPAVAAVMGRELAWSSEQVDEASRRYLAGLHQPLIAEKTS
ncbi:MAG TPA: glycerol-3-phosphate dehydrogenase C-terminal domain-containing protein, partial [Ktedonobacterales bacterium]|nr:glycerol-3-phosphate dehydrogenase C-terminal domain-containing protein [Ktedonobacterales bacterium]